MVFRMRSGLFFLCLLFVVGQLSAQMSWSNIKELTDYKKNLKEYLKSADKKKDDGALLAKIGECYYMLNQMQQAQSYYEQAIVKNGMQGEFKKQYAMTLMALQNYPAAKHWFSLYAADNQSSGKHYADQIDKLDLLNKIAPIFQVENLKQSSTHAEMAVSMIGSDVYYLQDHASKGKSLHKIFADGTVSAQEVGQDLSGISYFNFSGNGQMVCFTKQATYLGQRLIPEAGLNDELYIAAVDPAGRWVNPVKFTHTKSGFNCSYPSLNMDGTVIYFSSDRADGFGGQDIYLSIKDGVEWSFPVNAGVKVNSPGNEITPYVTESSLYFSSNWNVGFGGYDVYRAANMNGVFTKLYHQGQLVNSARDDYGFVMNEKTNTGYFISNRADGNGLEDLFKVTKPDQNYVINIKDALNNSNISKAALDLSACGGTQTFTDENGQFVFQLLSDSGCRIRVEKPGYEITFLEVSKMKGKEYTILLESSYPTVIGQILDQNTGQGLDDVKIAVQNMATNEVQNMVSDNSGSFTCKLISGYTYQVRYLKQGYQQNSKTINTGTKVSKDVLGSILLSKESVNIVNTAPVSTPTPAPTAPKNTFNNTTPSNFQAIVSSGFAVQIAAIRPSKIINLEAYKRKLAAFGEVYVKESTDYNRVRVGVFNTKQEAESAKSRIRSAGYGSAYVVTEEGVTSKSGAPELFTSRSSLTTSAPSVEYKIRLAALKNTGNVDRNILNNYGRVETTQSKGLTIFYLAGFNDLNAANSVLQNVKNQGYPGAFLMKSINGTLERVK